MASEVFTLTFTPDDVLESAMKQYGQGAGDIVQEVYKDFAGEHIAESIINAGVFPVSGRKFKGHSRGAKATGPKLFSHEISGLSLTVIARGRFGYLIFPDEGRGKHNPVAHHFMQAGVEKAAPEVIDRILAKLTE